MLTQQEIIEEARSCGYEGDSNSEALKILCDEDYADEGPFIMDTDDRLYRLDQWIVFVHGATQRAIITQYSTEQMAHFEYRRRVTMVSL